MTDDIDFYDLLDVSADASQDDIKQAFREQVRVYHPDLNDDDRAQAQFTALKKAYDILGDPVERQAYDRLGHEDYVAKRTSGLPSPDVWKRSTNSRESESEGTEKTGQTTIGGSSTGASAGTGTDDSTGSSTTTGTSTSGTTTGHTGSSARTQTGTGASATGTGGGRAAGTATGASTGSSSSTTSHRTRSNTTASGRATAGSTRSSTSDTHNRFAGNPLFRWWRNQNFAWPLIWTAIVTYLAGLVHFGLENEASLLDLSRELQAAGTDLATVWTLLSSSRHGIATAIGFVSGVEFFTPPIEPVQWYGALAGIVLTALLVVLAARIAWRTHTWGPVSLDETIVVAIALAAVTLLLGGPFLAGAVLMPLFFGVIVHRTHQLPGWSPSYLYVVCVSAPLAGFGLSAAGYGTLAADLALFVVIPLVGALGLPMRVSIRTHFRR
ncbi:J domain-containing protein [Natronosalvus vescus]|uniref:J domain-containing protein n=1 Tax=Natronosalvus vescus TaxID=2953881 RepID=UPI0020919A06|nr:DnaJ domain-containing protein [Natronosalvus vescus]